MAKGGRKYRLLLYEYILNRWWPKTFLLAIAIFVNVGAFWASEWYFQKNPAENKLSDPPLVSVCCFCSNDCDAGVGYTAYIR